MRPATTLRDALDDPRLLGHVLSGPSWLPWRTLLIAAMGEKLTPAERVIFRELTNREVEPGCPVEEFVGVIGRRGGKSRAISVLASFIAGLCQHRNLVPGERGVLLIIAPDTQQADIALGYIEANFRNSPILSQLVEARVARELRLTNGVDISVRASDFRRLRGPTFCCVIADEAAFWQTSEYSSNPDSEILGAVRPGLATTSGPMFIISSPYAKKGELFRLYQKHFGPAGDPLVLVAQAPSRVMNPSLSQTVVDRATERDPASAAAEFGAQFRNDVQAFIDAEVVERCVLSGVRERPPDRRFIYKGFADMSGGGHDAAVLCIAHSDIHKQIVSIDLIREIKSPHSPEMACEEFSKLLKSYRLSRVVTDKYALQWPIEQYRRFGIIAEQSAGPKGSLYVELLPYLNSARVELLDEPRGINQICSLERRTGRGRGEIIDHPPNGFDDVANAIAGAVNICAKRGGYDPSWGCGNEEEPEVDIEEARRQRIIKVFGSLEGAEAYKQRQRALYGRSVSFPWDTRY